MAGAWYEVGRAIRALLQSAGTKPRSAKRRAGTAQTYSASGRERTTRDGGTGPFELSPGQIGDGRTRDLEPSELARVRLEYAPNPDGDPDPGEVVWTWVPYVENDGRGKDRPVLIIGRIDATSVVGCYLSTKHHRGFISIGAGAWDSQGRESFLSPERLLRITHDGMRREGVQVDRPGFDRAVTEIRKRYQTG